MARIVIVGGGPGGLATAIFSARRGHEVVVIERDSPPPSGSAEDDFLSWARPGVPQARHSHNFLGRACVTLADEAPDVVAALIERGAMKTRVGVAGNGTDPDDPAFALLARRLVFEAVLRRATECEPGITVLSRTAAECLVADSEGPVPIVRGVHITGGEVVPADLVVDAGGRRSAASTWLKQCGARPFELRMQPCGFHYLTRFYRLTEGAEFPTTSLPIISELDYASVMAFPADNRSFSLTLAVSTEDPVRRRLREPEVFDRVLGAVPLTEPWLSVSEPISDIGIMARIENRWRRLIDADDRPVVGGLVLVGDASLHTNPTFGRGVSLAFAQAQHLASTAERVQADPIGYVAAVEAWTSANLGIWYGSQVAADRVRLDHMAAGLRGEHLAPADDSISRFIAAMLALAPTDEVVARALARVAHLLTNPKDLFGDAQVVRRVGRYLDQHPVIDRPAEGPTRTEFEQLAGV
jgi:2-polyprenyl-6-methoxyphenol hydroxylase-like FAD-dependent oxidoreductase